MKIFKFIFGKVVLPASFFFTLYSIFAYLINASTEEGKNLFIRFSLVLTYCIIIALANNIFKAELSMLIKIAIHYSAFLIPLIAIAILTERNHLLSPVFILVTVVYALIAIPILLIQRVLRKKDNAELKYESQFK